MALALSTAWNAFRHDNGEKVLFEIKDLGFKEVELGFNLTALMIEDIGRVLKDSSLKIVSLHNYCPVPETFKREDALPDCYSMSSIGKEERQLAVDFTKRSIDTAASLGAKVLVLHCGRVEIRDRTRDLIDLYSRDLKDSQEFRELRDDTVKERESLSQTFLENTLKSLEELNKHAQKAGVLIGVETRFYYSEIPSFDEIGIILKKFKGSSIFYWHDTGHAQLMENLGFARHEDYLKQYSKSMIGIHLHDILGCQDHMAPGKGSLDFKKFAPFLKKNTVKVIEAHHPATAQEIIQGRRFLEEVLE